MPALPFDISHRSRLFQAFLILLQHKQRLAAVTSPEAAAAVAEEIQTAARRCYNLHSVRHNLSLVLLRSWAVSTADFDSRRAALLAQQRDSGVLRGQVVRWLLDAAAERSAAGDGLQEGT